MSETKLKTVGDCVNLCKSAGIEISHLDDNLFETAGAIDGLLVKISQLEKEKYESIGAWNSQLEKASARVKELEQENAELKKRQDEYVWMTRDEIKVYSDLQQELMGQSLAEHEKQVKIQAIEGFVRECKNSTELTGIEKLTVHALMVKHFQFLEQLKEQ